MLKMLTTEQFWSLVRTSIQSIGASLVVLGAVDPQYVDALIGLTQTTQVLIGAALNFGTTVYSLYIRRPAGLVATAAALPEVKEIVAAPDLAKKVDAPAVVPG